ncbi:MAG: MarR family winged helix-turn-helix transcriptional regulator [Kineosporiaceae bacterium]
MPTVVTTTAARWLTAQEQRTWRGLVPLLHGLPAALDRQLQADAGIPHAYYMILAMLSEAPDGELRMRELAQRTSTSLSRLSHAVARLESLGWVARRTCPTDRRGQIARLTEAGTARLVELAPGHVDAVRRVVFDALTPEQLVQLDAITTAIGAALTEAGRPCQDGVMAATS